MTPYNLFYAVLNMLSFVHQLKTAQDYSKMRTTERHMNLKHIFKLREIRP